MAATLRSLRLHRAGERGDFLAVPETVLKGSSRSTWPHGPSRSESCRSRAPASRSLAATVKGLPLVPLQGYITDRLHLVVNDGTASAAGELTVAAGGPASSASFTGRASVDRLATVDAHAAEDLVKWDSLVFTGVSFASEPFRLEIADVTLAGLASKVILAADSAIAFVDRSVSPEFRMDVTGLAGSVSGLSSLALTAADVDLRATLNGQAPVSLTGKVNMLAGNLFLDIKVASPKATHLPVRLAISLLKHREGRITLNLPVSGSLDDPKFRVGRIILKVIVNLLAKVATSPFSLLGSLFGGSSAELDTVAFAPGAATLDDTARGRLDILAKALNDRPGLRLEIAGRTDEAAEYDEYLTPAYKHGKFAKPRNFLGIAKKEPAPEMERLLRASLDPSPDALRHLATARAEAVQGYLLQTGKVKADQLFIVGPSGAAPAAKGKGDFSAVTSIDEVIGSYVAAEAAAGAVKSGEAAVYTKGEVSLALAGTGRGVVIGFDFGKLDIERTHR